MNLNRTLAVLTGVAALCAVTAASPAVATTALVTAGIGLLGGLPVIDAREGRRKRFEDDAVVTAYKRQVVDTMQCCQGQEGSVYSNYLGQGNWETCGSIGARRNEKLVKVPPQLVKAYSSNVDRIFYDQCIKPNDAVRINNALAVCQEAKPNALFEINYLKRADNEIIGVVNVTALESTLTKDDCDISFSLLDSGDRSITASDVGTLVGVASVAVAAARGLH